MKTVALIEDDSDLHQLVRYNLEKEGFRLVGLQTGIGALPFLRSHQPDLVLLDVMLPHADGFDICEAIRNDPVLSETPIIFLTARTCEEDRLVGFTVGGDDYVVKPFFIRELIARIQSRLKEPGGRPGLISSGELALDWERVEVTLAGKEIVLSTKEFQLLMRLMDRPGRVFSRSELLDQVWGSDRDVALRAVDVCVLRLRQKQNDEPATPKWIRSVRGIGYAFVPAGRN